MSKEPNSKNMDKIYLASVTGSEKRINIQIFEEKTQKTYAKFNVSTVKELFKTLLPLESQLKAVFLNVSTFKTSEYKSSYESSKAINEFLRLHSIPCHFCSNEYMTAFNILVTANITSSINDVIMCVNFDGDHVRFVCYQFTPKGYKHIVSPTTEDSDLKNIGNFITDKLKYGGNKKVMLYTMFEENKCVLKFYEHAIRSSIGHQIGNDNLIALEYENLTETEKSGKAIMEMAKWFFDKSYVKFYVLPLIQSTVEVISVIGNSRMKVITAEEGEEIPFEKSVFFAKSVQQCLMMKKEENEVSEFIKMDQNCHQIKATLTFASDCFPELKFEPIIIPEIKQLPEKLDEMVKSKIPVIGFFGHSSVVCVNECGKYKFLDLWNGVYGNELFINFEEAKTKYGTESIKPKKTNMSCGVYDLIKVLSMPAEKNTVNESCKLVITKDSDNPVLIEFDNHEGRKTAASPQFLMAMLIKEQIKRIRNEMNIEKPKEIGFYFFDKMTAVEKKRIEIGIEEACKLLKLKCTFVNI